MSIFLGVPMRKTGQPKANQHFLIGTSYFTHIPKICSVRSDFTVVNFANKEDLVLM